MSWDGDAPWMDTQDLQLFRAPRDTILVPVRVQAMFDGSKGDPKLSDHDGFLVTYRLTWNLGGAEKEKSAASFATPASRGDAARCKSSAT